jgi:hypothetical protein
MVGLSQKLSLSRTFRIQYEEGIRARQARDPPKSRLSLCGLMALFLLASSSIPTMILAEKPGSSGQDASKKNQEQTFLVKKNCATTIYSAPHPFTNTRRSTRLLGGLLLLASSYPKREMSTAAAGLLPRQPRLMLVPSTTTTCWKKTMKNAFPFSVFVYAPYHN